MGGLILVGSLSGFWAQTGSVVNWSSATFIMRLGEAAAPREGECVPCPDIASYNLAFALQLGENQKRTSGRVTNGRLGEQR
jgi:hypothetical protein